MSTSFQISIHIPTLRTLSDSPTRTKSYFGLKFRLPVNCCCLPSRKIGSFNGSSSRLRCSLTWGSAGGYGFVLRKVGDRRRSVLVRVNRGFDFNGGGGGGGGGDSNTARLLGNLALAIGLTYLSMTGQLGWVLDAIVSVWLLAVILPIVGLGAFLWFAGQDIIQGSCPNCGNDFQIFKSSLDDGVQLCPFCTQPFSVQDNKFVRQSPKFSSEPKTQFKQAFSGNSSRTKKGSCGSQQSSDLELSNAHECHFTLGMLLRRWRTRVERCAQLQKDNTDAYKFQSCMLL